MLLRVASRRATDAELGDVVEEYAAAGRSASWLVSQVVSIVQRRRSHLTISERGAEMLSNVRNDSGYALRTLGRNPGFANAAIVPIALGIGINTGVFSILNSVAWRSLPVPDADALASIYQDFRGGPRRTVHGARSLFSIPEYRAYRDEAHTLSGLMAYSRQWTVTLGRESPQEINGHIVGIVRDAQVSQAQHAISSYVYLPATRGSQRGISVLARTRMDVDGFAAAVRAETARMDGNLVVHVQPLSDNLAILQTLSQITTSVAGVLSLLAVGLAAMGVYGVVAYVVTRRRREVGIRMALGASVRDVRRLILAQTLRPAAAGIAIGIAIAAGVARVLQSVLFGVSPFDPVAYLGAPLVMVAVAALATWLPTRQALGADPITTLRSE